MIMSAFANAIKNPRPDRKRRKSIVIHEKYYYAHVISRENESILLDDYLCSRPQGMVYHEKVR